MAVARGPSPSTVIVTVAVGRSEMPMIAMIVVATIAAEEVVRGRTARHCVDIVGPEDGCRTLKKGIVTRGPIAPRLVTRPRATRARTTRTTSTRTKRHTRVICAVVTAMLIAALPCSRPRGDTATTGLAGTIITSSGLHVSPVEEKIAIDVTRIETAGVVR